MKARLRLARLAPPSIAVRLVLALALPAVVVVLSVGLAISQLVERAARNSLERELVATSRIAASTINPQSARLLSPGDEKLSRSYRRLVARLSAIQNSTHSVRAMIIGPDLSVLVDGNGDLAIGAQAPRAALDRLEIEAARDGLKPEVSVPFSGKNGKRHLAVYARVPESLWDEPGLIDALPTPAPPLILALEAPADALDAAHRVSRTVLLIVVVAVLLVAVLVLAVAATITRPLLQLADAAEHLGEGALEEPLPRQPGRDEVARLSRTLERMRKALRERDQERQMMLAGIAHEIRNPLGGMELFLGLLKESIDEQPADPSRTLAQEQMGRVQNELHYLTDVVNSFLSYSRDTALSIESVSLAALVQSACRVATDAERYGVLCEVEDLQVECDATRLRQAVLNTIENALQALGPGTPEVMRVQVRSKIEDDDVILSISDDGPGMEPAILTRAFAPFFTTKEKGSGLGLPLVRKLCRDHGGDAWIDTAVGRGTTVYLRFPRVRAQAKQSYA